MSLGSTYARQALSCLGIGMTMAGCYGQFLRMDRGKPMNCFPKHSNLKALSISRYDELRFDRRRAFVADTWPGTILTTNICFNLFELINLLQLLFVIYLLMIRCTVPHLIKTPIDDVQEGQYYQTCKQCCKSVLN